MLKSQLKFRAWVAEDSYGRGHMAIQGTPDLETLSSFIFHYGDLELMLFTGLVDKNGVEIFENDIVEVTKEYNWDLVNEKYLNKHKITGCVKFYTEISGLFSGFHIMPDEPCSDDSGWYDCEGWLDVNPNKIEVISNTYDAALATLIKTEKNQRNRASER